MHTLTASQKRMLTALESWLENFYCNQSEHTDSLVFALDNGFTIHAVECMAGTGATDKRFDRIYSALVKSVGDHAWNELNRFEASQLCNWARIQICADCNAHAFTDPSDNPATNCESCLKPFPSLVDTFLAENKSDILEYLTRLVAELKRDLTACSEEYTEAGADTPSIDIRLCVDLETKYRSHGWIIRTGLSDYDPYHSEYCSASCVTPDTDPSELLEDLITQISE